MGMATGVGVALLLLPLTLPLSPSLLLLTEDATLSPPALAGLSGEAMEEAGVSIGGGGSGGCCCCCLW